MKVLITIIFLALTSKTAVAQPPYLTELKEAYPQALDLHNCQTCHGKTELNNYGKDYENNNHDLKAIEGFDSDVDGYTNIAEINAGTEPGNKDGHPAQ
jgi:hypothetical protein